MYDEAGSKIVDKLMEKAKKNKVNVYFPTDFVIADGFKADANSKLATKAEGIPKGWLGLDVGQESQKCFKDVILKSKLIVWNG